MLETVCSTVRRNCSFQCHKYCQYYNHSYDISLLLLLGIHSYTYQSTTYNNNSFAVKLLKHELKSGGGRGWGVRKRKKIKNSEKETTCPFGSVQNSYSVSKFFPMQIPVIFATDSNDIFFLFLVFGCCCCCC